MVQLMGRIGVASAGSVRTVLTIVHDSMVAAFIGEIVDMVDMVIMVVRNVSGI